MAPRTLGKPSRSRRSVPRPVLRPLLRCVLEALAPQSLSPPTRQRCVPLAGAPDLGLAVRLSPPTSGSWAFAGRRPPHPRPSSARHLCRCAAAAWPSSFVDSLWWGGDLCVCVCVSGRAAFLTVGVVFRGVP